MLLGRFRDASMRINISQNNRPTCASAGESAVRRDYLATFYNSTQNSGKWRLSTNLKRRICELRLYCLGFFSFELMQPSCATLRLKISNQSYISNIKPNTLKASRSGDWAFLS